MDKKKPILISDTNTE